MFEKIFSGAVPKHEEAPEDEQLKNAGYTDEQIEKMKSLDSKSVLMSGVAAGETDPGFREGDVKAPENMPEPAEEEKFVPTEADIAEAGVWGKEEGKKSGESNPVEPGKFVPTEADIAEAGRADEWDSALEGAGAVTPEGQVKSPAPEKTEDAPKNTGEKPPETPLEVETSQTKAPVTEIPSEPEAVPEEAVKAPEQIPETKKEIDADVILRFEDNFGLGKEALESIEGFSGLSRGQQLMAAENLMQLDLGRSKEKAMALGRAPRSGEYKEAVSGLKLPQRAAMFLIKKYRVAKLEQMAAGGWTTDEGMEINKGMLSELVRGTKEYNLEVEERNGRLETKYITEKNNSLNEGERKVVTDFNFAANEFARLPYEWGLPTATDEQKQKYAEIKERYEIAADSVRRSAITRGMNVARLSSEMAKIESPIMFNQLINSSPDAEEELMKMRNRKAWLSAFKNVATERGIYAGAGFLGRSLVYGTIGWLAAPAVAAISGGFLARKRTREELSERDIMARRGEDDANRETAQNVASAEGQKTGSEGTVIRFGLADKLDNLAEKLSANPTDEGIRMLEDRIAYTERKIEEGKVDFGNESDRIAIQSKLLKSLTLAKSAVIMHRGADVRLLMGENTPESKIRERLGSFLEFRDSKIDEARKSFVRKQVIKGMAYGAGFAFLGAGARAVCEHFGWLNKPKFDSDEYLKQTMEKINRKAQDFFGPQGKGQVELASAHGSRVFEVENDPGDMPLEEFEKMQRGVSGYTPKATEGAFAPEKPYPGEGVEPGAFAPEKPYPGEGVEPGWFEQMPTAKENFIHTVQKGESVWKIIKSQMESAYGDKFKNLTPSQKTYLIDSFKDRVAVEPEKFGLKNIDRINIGQKLDFSSLFEDQNAVSKAFEKTGALAEAQSVSIGKNNGIISEWQKNHHGVKLDTEKINEIIAQAGVSKGGVAGQAAIEASGPSGQPEGPSGAGYEADAQAGDAVSGSENLAGWEESEALRLAEEAERMAKIDELENRFIENIDLKPAEYEAVKDVRLGRFLEVMPTSKNMWEAWHTPNANFDIPHDGMYDFMEFEKDVKLADFIRNLSPGEQMKETMTVRDFVRMAVESRI